MTGPTKSFEKKMDKKTTSRIQSVCRNVAGALQLVWVRQTIKRCCLSTIAICLVANLSSSNFAQDVDWINSLGGNYEVGSNWSSGTKPSNTDTAVFGLNETYTVNLADIQTAGSFRQSDGNVSFVGGGRLTSLSDTSIDGTMSLAGSTLDGSSLLKIGDLGTGNVSISDGGVLSGYGGYLGYGSGSIGSVTVDGEQSRLSFVNFLTVGSNGTGQLNIDNGASATAGYGQSSIIIGGGTDSAGVVTLNGAGSFFGGQANLNVGSRGSGTLNINDTGTVSSLDALIGSQSGSTGAVNVNDVGTWETNNLYLGLNGGTGSLSVAETGRVWVGNDRGGFVSHASFPKVDIVVSDSGGDGIMVVENGSVVNGDINIGTLNGNTGVFSLSSGSVFNGNASLGYNAGALGTITVEGNETEFNSDSLRIGFRGAGAMTVANQAVVNAGGVYVGSTSYPIPTNSLSGLLSLQGHGTTLNATAISIGSSFIDDAGTVRVENGASVFTTRGNITKGKLTVSGSNSTWRTVASDDVPAGISGLFSLNGELNVESQGLVSSEQTVLGNYATATVTGNGSQWLTTNDMGIRGSVQVNSGGLVSVGGTTWLLSSADVSVNGGRFEFGTTDVDSYELIGGTSGSLKGQVAKTGYTHIESLWDDYSKQNLNTSEVVAANYGVIYGSGVSQSQLVNLVGGEVRTLGNEWARFGGQGSTNAGEINNFGGVFETENDLTNTNTGFIGGRGQFIIGNPLTSNGLTNLGRMAFTSGAADILGTVNNIEGGKIITSGYAITSFFDDVIHNGSEIRTQEGSATVFLGGYSGAGSLTGTGDVFFEGAVSIGNSPAVVGVEGDIHLGSSSSSLFEIAGIAWGEFDKFLIGGDFSMDGQLSVELLDGFLLQNGQEFLIAEVGGLSSGQFDGLSEGALIGNFNGTDLFISYSGGDGNDVSLFSAVPEPGAIAFLSMLGCLSLLKRRRSNLTMRN